MDVDVYRPGEARPAGLWIRAAAAMIDFAVFAIVQFSFGVIGGWLYGPTVEDSLAFQFSVLVFTFLFAGVYTTFLHALGGQTIGKMMVGIRVVSLDGEPPSVGPALVRFFGYFLSLGTLWLGFAMAGLRRDKRALHDLLAATRVEWLARRAPRAEPERPADAAPAAAPTNELTPPVA